MTQHIFEKLETFKDLFDNAHDLIHIVDPDGRIIFANKAWKDNLGYTLEEAYGKSIYSFVQPADRERFSQYRQNILQGAAHPNEIIFGAVAKSGEVVFLEGFLSAKIVDGKALYTRGIFRNVTRRLQHERELEALHEELKAREKDLQQLFFYAPDAIIVIDAHSIVRYWNPKAAEVFGWSFEEVVGKPLPEIIIPAAYREAHREGMQRYLATGEARVLNKTIEITALHKRGHEFYVALTISSTSQNGQIAFIAFIRDIDEQKRNARELEQKKIQLEESNQQLEQFAHVVSHDIKEPIRKIMVFTDRLQSEIASAASERAMDFLRRIEGAASRLSAMVEGILKSSSLKAARMIAEKVDLNRLMHEIETDLELVIEKKQALIQYERLPLLEGSPVLLYQLFYNLINNSLKFSRADMQPVIQIHSRRVPAKDAGQEALPGTDYFELRIQDNGIGFPADYAEAIFKTFSRLHPKHQYEGTGIGLSLCKSIVEKHGGTIHASGKEDEGATFTIYLPERQTQIQNLQL